MSRTRNLIALVLVVGTIIYGTLRAQSFFFGPTVTILHPAPHAEIAQVSTLQGEVEGAAYLSVNDQRVYPNQQGVFTAELLLPAGYTVVTVYARNRRDRETIIYLPLYISTYEKSKHDNEEEI